MPIRLEADPTFADRLRAADRTLYGMWSCGGSALAAEICAGSGLDIVLIDGEHSPVGLESILAQLQAVAAYPAVAVVRAAYGASVEYSWQSLLSFVENAHDPNLVLLVLGDHQPHHYVSGYGIGRDVPVSMIAHDPKVLQRIDDWGWQPGLRPQPDAPVWRMDTIRDRFLQAFSPASP